MATKSTKVTQPDSEPEAVIDEETLTYGDRGDNSGGGLVGGPATTAVPRGRRTNQPNQRKQRQGDKQASRPDQENDGGESTLSGQPRDTDGDRPK